MERIDGTVKRRVKNCFITVFVLILIGCAKDDLFLGTAGDDYRVEITLSGDVENFDQTLEVNGTDFTGDFSGSDFSNSDIFEILPGGASITHSFGYLNSTFGDGGEKTIVLAGDDRLTFFVLYTNSPKEQLEEQFNMEASITVFKNDDRIENINRTFSTSRMEKTELKWFYAY